MFTVAFSDSGNMLHKVLKIYWKRIQICFVYYKYKAAEELRTFFFYTSKGVNKKEEISDVLEIFDGKRNR